MLMQYVPSGFQRVNSGGQTFWLKEHEGEPQLNLPRSGLSTRIKVPGIGPKLTLRLFPSTLLRSQKSGLPELERVSSTSVAGDCPVIPLHSIPKLLSGAPQSPVVHTNFPSFQLQPVLAQYLMATVSAGTTCTSSVWGGISQPVLGISGTPNPPTQMVLSQLFLKRKILVGLQETEEAERARRTRMIAQRAFIGFIDSIQYKISTNHPKFLVKLFKNSVVIIFYKIQVNKKK